MALASPAPPEGEQAALVGAAVHWLHQEQHPQAVLTALFWLDSTRIIGYGRHPDGNLIFFVLRATRAQE